VQEEAEWSEHEGESQRGNTERRANTSTEAVKPNESPCDEVKGEDVQPHGEAPLWGRE
jgi:hypothetical protein